MENLSKLHPVAQVVALVVVGAIVCIFIWQFWKTFRET